LEGDVFEVSANEDGDYSNASGNQGPERAEEQGHREQHHNRGGVAGMADIAVWACVDDVMASIGLDAYSAGEEFVGPHSPEDDGIGKQEQCECKGIEGDGERRR